MLEFSSQPIGGANGSQPGAGEGVLSSAATRLELPDGIAIHVEAGHVEARVGGGSQLERATQFAGWLVQNFEQLHDAAPGSMPEIPGAPYLAQMHSRLQAGRLQEGRLPADGISERLFVELASRMPFSQVLSDLGDLKGVGREDKDADVRGYVRDALAPQPGDVVLDAGCSTGRNFFAYPDGVRCVGIDVDLASLLVGAFAWEAHAPDRKPTLCCASVLSMPVEDRSIDCAQSIVVLGYVPIRSALGELRRVLKPGGRLALALEGPGFLRELVDAGEASLKDRIGFARWKAGQKLQEAGFFWQGRKYVGRLAGIVLYTVSSISKVLEDCGFEVLDARSVRDYRGLPRVVGVTARSR